MWRRFQGWYRALRIALDFSETTDRVFKLLGIPIVAGVLTTLVGLIYDYPHWAIVAGSAVFALISVGLCAVVHVQEKLSVFRRLNVAGIAVTPFVKDGKYYVNAAALLQNTGRPMYYKLLDTHLEINGHSNPSKNLLSAVEPITAHDQKSIVFSTAETSANDLDITGRTRVELAYGHSPRAMDYRLTHESKIEAKRQSADAGGLPVRVTTRRIDHFKTIPD